MIIKTLVENTAVSEDFKSEHGLSFYIETKSHKLLFDVGASTFFIDNASKLGVDLTAVDALIISHGHNDHGGGIGAFLHINEKAPIYFNKQAFMRHYANRPDGSSLDIGLDETLLPNQRFVFIDDFRQIDEELSLFSDVKGQKFYSSACKHLFMVTDAGMVPDDFAHEQNLVVQEEGKFVLFAGCAHRGIVNIVNRFQERYGRYPDHVIGGLHLYNPGSGKSEDPELIEQIGEYLLSTGSVYYTCHCTGMEAYAHLKGMIKDKMNYLAAGSCLNL